MSRLNRVLVAAAGLSLALPALADAQQTRVRERPVVAVARQQEPRGWLGFSYTTTALRAAGPVRTAIVIQEIVRGSPAERAGLLAGDTLMDSLGYSLAPGDQVRIRVRRGGRERELQVQAAERPAEYALAPRGGQYIFEIDPDSIRGRMRVYMDSIRVNLDSLRIPRMRIERTPEGVWMYTDSGRVRIMPPDSVWRQGRGVYVFPPDSLRGMFQYRFPRDSLRLHLDSAFVRVLPDMRAFRWNADSLRIHFDSLGLTGNRAGVWLGAPGQGITVIGSRAIAGAELMELNPGLGEYFGADEGVLVARVPGNTPAARAGLLAGDVIVAVNGRAVDDVSSLRRQISRLGSGEPIRLEILRKNQRRTIELTNDEP
jgi:hypothetical protein